MLKEAIWEQKKLIVYTVIAGTVGGLTSVALFAQSGFLISKAALMPPFYIILILAAFLKLFGVAKSTGKYAERLLSHKVTFHLMSSIRETYFHKLLQQTEIFHRYKSGDLLHRITSDVETLQNYFLRVVYPPLVTGIVFLATILFTLIFSWQMAVVLMVGYLVCAFAIPALFANWFFDEPMDLKQQLSSKTTEFLYGYETLQHFNLLQSKTDELLALSEQYGKNLVKEERKRHLAHSLNQLLALLAAIGVLLLGAIAVTNGTLQGVYLAMLLMVTLTVFELATPLAAMPSFRASTATAYNRLQSFTSHQPGQQQVHSLLPICFEQVTYQYEESLSPVLQDVSFTIRNGEKIAIIGVSGSGKTTLFHLLLKERMVKHGQITCNDVRVDEIDDNSLFSQLSVQLQHNHFFVGSVRENLYIANERATDEEMISLLLHVNLPLSLDDFLQEKALNLSGGERQRLAYARVLLQNHSVFLLDEPFSSVDAKLRARLTAALCERSNTVLMITHDTESLHHFDHIYQIENGQLKLIQQTSS